MTSAENTPSEEHKEATTVNPYVAQTMGELLLAGQHFESSSDNVAWQEAVLQATGNLENSSS